MRRPSTSRRDSARDQYGGNQSGAFSPKQFEGVEFSMSPFGYDAPQPPKQVPTQRVQQPPQPPQTALSLVRTENRQRTRHKDVRIDGPASASSPAGWQRSPDDPRFISYWDGEKYTGHRFWNGSEWLDCPGPLWRLDTQLNIWQPPAKTLPLASTDLTTITMTPGSDTADASLSFVGMANEESEKTGQSPKGRLRLLLAGGMRSRR